MSEERKPVVCPWCWRDMVAREAQDIFHGKHNVYVCEACEAVSPIAYSDKAAYAAATATPPNRPLGNS
jgi:ribosomal protein L37AE/L43A